MPRRANRPPLLDCPWPGAVCPTPQVRRRLRDAAEEHGADAARAVFKRRIQDHNAQDAPMSSAKQAEQAATDAAKKTLGKQVNADRHLRLVHDDDVEMGDDTAAEWLRGMRLAARVLPVPPLISPDLP